MSTFVCIESTTLPWLYDPLVSRGFELPVFPDQGFDYDLDWTQNLKGVGALILICNPSPRQTQDRAQDIAQSESLHRWILPLECALPLSPSSPPSLQSSRHQTWIVIGGHNLKIIVAELQTMEVVTINTLRLEDLLPDPF